jgi:single-strand DNA-binding protein
MFQQILLVGNLGADPELRYTPQGTPVASFTLAVNRVWTDNQGERQEKTTWFRVTAWRKQAETCAEFLRKGRRVLVVGEMEEASTWTDRDGHPRASLEVTALTVKFLPSGRNGSDENSAAEAASIADADEIPF